MSFQYEPIEQKPRLFTVDTDIGADSDDAGSLALLFHRMKQKPLPLGAIINCTPCDWGSGAVDAIAKARGVEGVTLGQSEDRDWLADSSYHVYDRILAEEYSRSYRTGTLVTEEAISCYLRLLEQAEPKGMILIGIGPMHLFDRLWFEASDLISQKVYALICMGGVYSGFERYGHREYNFYTVPGATKRVFENYPCPIISVGMELGRAVRTTLEKNPCDPVHRAYEIHTHGGMQRPSWDPLTLLFALEGEGEHLILSEPGINEIREDGSNYFHPDRNGTHYYVKANMSCQQLSEEISEMIASS